MVIGSENMPAIPLNSTLEETMIPSTEKVKAEDSSIAGILEVFYLVLIKKGCHLRPPFLLLVTLQYVCFSRL